MENSIANIWNAKLDNKGRTNRYIVKNNQYNQDIEVGEDVTFGILVNEPFQQFPTDYTMIGNSQIIEEDDYSVEYIVNEDWGSGFSASLIICNKSNYDFEDWTLRGKFKNEIANIWNAQIREHEKSHYIISGSDYTQNLSAGESISIGFNCIAGNSSLNFEQLELEFIRTNMEQQELNKNTAAQSRVRCIHRLSPFGKGGSNGGKNEQGRNFPNSWRVRRYKIDKIGRCSKDSL